VRRPVIATALGVCAAIVVASAPVAAAPKESPRKAPAGRAFYVPPDPLPEAAPGTLIWSAPFRAIPGAQAWKILYHSRTVDGKDIAVSGVVVAPTGTAPRGGRVVVSWAHGATGLADMCAPSKQPDIASGSSGAGIEDLVSFLSRIPLRAEETTVIPAPIFHAWGLGHLPLAMVMGSTVVLRRRFDPKQVLADIQEHRATTLVVVPVMPVPVVSVVVMLVLDVLVMLVSVVDIVPVVPVAEVSVYVVDDSVVVPAVSVLMFVFSSFLQPNAKRTRATMARSANVFFIKNLLS